MIEILCQNELFVAAQNSRQLKLGFVTKGL